jgi:hypothetical protein
VGEVTDVDRDGLDDQGEGDGGPPGPAEADAQREDLADDGGRVDADVRAGQDDGEADLAGEGADASPAGLARGGDLRLAVGGVLLGQALALSVELGAGLENLALALQALVLDLCPGTLCRPLSRHQRRPVARRSR